MGLRILEDVDVYRADYRKAKAALVGVLKKRLADNRAAKATLDMKEPCRVVRRELVRVDEDITKLVAELRSLGVPDYQWDDVPPPLESDSETDHRLAYERWPGFFVSSRPPFDPGHLAL